MSKKTKKKTESIGVISGLDSIRKSRLPIDVPFHTGGHMTEKDRPRKKYKARGMEDING